MVINVSRFPTTATGTRILKGLKMKDETVNAIAMYAVLFAVICFLLSILIGLNGCMIAEGEKTTYLPTGEVVSHVKVKMTQCMTDSSRTNFKVEIPDLGDVELGSSIMSPEKFKEILAELKPFLITLMGL